MMTEKEANEMIKSFQNEMMENGYASVVVAAESYARDDSKGNHIAMGAQVAGNQDTVQSLLKGIADIGMKLIEATEKQIEAHNEQ